MLDKRLQRRFQPEQFRLAADEGQHLHAEGALQRSVLVELVEHLLGLRAALELDDDRDAAPVGLVAQVGDGVKAPVAHEFGDALDEGGLVHLIGQFGDDDAVPVAAHFLDVRHPAHDHAPLALAVGRLDPFHPHDDAAGREVRPFDELHQLLDADLVRGVVVVNQVADSGGDFAQVVGGDVRRHAHGDAGRAVEQQVRQAGREHFRLLQ